MLASSADVQNEWVAPGDAVKLGVRPDARAASIEALETDIEAGRVVLRNVS
jgi:hypothetical protein